MLVFKEFSFLAGDRHVHRSPNVQQALSWHSQDY